MKSGRQQSISNPDVSANDMSNQISSYSLDRRRFLQYAAGVGAMVSISGSPFSQAQQNAAAGKDTLLPDGTEFVSWEQPLKFSKTYYVDNTSAKADDNGPGTNARPFRTINKAAQVLQPGERVVIASGVYRECVRPVRGGTGPTQMISYEAAPGAKVVVKGSEVLKDGWVQDAALPFRGPNAPSGPAIPTWRFQLTAAMFPNLYNPFALDSVMSAREWLDTKVVDMGPYFRRRGLAFVDGMPLEPVEVQRELTSPRLPGPPPPGAPIPMTGLPPRTRGGPVMQEIGGSPEARLWVETSGQAIHVRIPSGTPAEHMVEITTREQAFVPAQMGLAYIRVKGITFQHAGNSYPIPQRGLVSTAGGNHWIIEGNTIEWANGVGLDIANGDWNAAPTPQAGVGQIIRGNTIRYCGVEGIGGMGTQNTLIEDNLIEWCGWADAERAWEAAAAKFHRAQHMLFRRNVIRHIRHANALWFDSGDANCRITRNVFADVVSVASAIHMEMNTEQNQIDNNVIWDVRNAEPGTGGQRGCAGSGIFINASDKMIIAQNLIGRCDNSGIWAITRPDRARSGTAVENKIYNNIFAKCGKSGIVFLNPKNEADGNLYVALPSDFQGFFTGDQKQYVGLSAWREAHGWDKNSAVADVQIDFNADTLELTINSSQPLPKVSAFGKIDVDLEGKATGETRAAGPLADPTAKRVWKLDPRSATQAG